MDLSLKDYSFEKFKKECQFKFLNFWAVFGQFCSTAVEVDEQEEVSFPFFNENKQILFQVVHCALTCVNHVYR